MKRTVGLHPVVILLALAVGALLSGVMGAIAAIPVAAAVSAATKYVAGVEDIDGQRVAAVDPSASEPPRVARGAHPDRRR